MSKAQGFVPGSGVCPRLRGVPCLGVSRAHGFVPGSLVCPGTRDDQGLGVARVQGCQGLTDVFLA